MDTDYPVRRLMEGAGAAMPPEKKTDESPDLEKRIADLESALATAQAALPVTLIPEHGAGPKMQVAPTWSQAEQAEAIKRFS